MKTGILNYILLFSICNLLPISYCHAQGGGGGGGGNGGNGGNGGRSGGGGAGGSIWITQTSGSFTGTQSYIGGTAGTGGNGGASGGAGGLGGAPGTDCIGAPSGTAGTNGTSGVAGSAGAAATAGETGSFLPIELLSFEATVSAGSVQLKWSVASETNNDFYTVEKSKDAVSYEEAGTIKGAGTSTTGLFYMLTDNYPYPGTSYYKLKQTDFDGKFKRYGPIVVNYFPNFDINTVFFDAENNQLIYKINSKEEMQITAEIFNLLGNQIEQKTQTLTKGENTLSLMINISNGIYLLKLSGKHLPQTKTFMVGNHYE